MAIFSIPAYYALAQRQIEEAIKEGELERAVELTEGLSRGLTIDEEVDRLVTVNEAYSAIIGKFMDEEGRDLMYSLRKMLLNDIDYANLLNDPKKALDELKSFKELADSPEELKDEIEDLNELGEDVHEIKEELKAYREIIPLRGEDSQQRIKELEKIRQSLDRLR